MGPELAPPEPAPAAAGAFDRTVDAMSAAGTCLVLVIMVVMDADIVGRVLFGAPLRGVPEIVTMSIAAIVFLQLASTLRHGRVIQADAFLGWLRRRTPAAAHALAAAYHFAGAVAFAIVLCAVAPLAERAWRSGDIYGSPGFFTFPKWPVRAVILAGCAAVLVQFLVLGARELRAAARHRSAR
jgi:TRAP-type mannitol/chloroaromatic compound transport system permease small subunit